MAGWTSLWRRVGGGRRNVFTTLVSRSQSVDFVKVPLVAHDFLEILELVLPRGHLDGLVVKVAGSLEVGVEAVGTVLPRAWALEIGVAALRGLVVEAR